MATTRFIKKRIFYTDKGKGKVLVLLHGFMEDSKIWKDFASKLSKEFRVITIDLPGHGKSECVSDLHTMELQAEVVHHVLKGLKVKKCTMVGHSMGGYVTLAFAAKYPKMLNGIGLFNSHAFADTDADRLNRDRTINVVKKDHLSFVAGFIPGLFPDATRDLYTTQIDKMVRRGSRMTAEAVIAALEGMKVRNDQSELLKTTKLPVLFILGMKDPKAPVQRFWKMISLPAYSRTVVLREAGHMGYIESPGKTLKAVRDFM